MEYTIIWRGEGDDFLFTQIHEEIDEPNTVSSDEWVIRACRAENAANGISEEETQQEIDDMLKHGYDLLAVLGGELNYIW